MTSQYDQLFLALGRLEGKVDSILSLSAKLEAQIEAQDTRIRSLEHNKHFIMGMAAIIGAAVSAVVAGLVRVMGNLV